jgi:N-acetylmuramoyl-L-alanine amidase
VTANAKLCRADTLSADLRDVRSSTDPARLKAQILRAAVQDNADTISDRLPRPLRPARRRFALWARRVSSFVVPGAIVAAVVVARSLAAPGPEPVPAGEPLSEPAMEWTAEPPEGPAAVPDMSLLARPLQPRALGLGVRRVVLDAGHGGENLGTESAGGVREKDVTLDLARRAKGLLLQHGFEVVLTRTADDTLSLKERAAIANQHRGDIFVSIHLNSFKPASLRAIETYYLGPSALLEHEAIAAKENENSGYSLADMRTLLEGIYADARRDESKRLARAVQDAVLQGVRKTDVAMRDRGVKTAPFVVLVATDMPAILAEVSCLSNPGEAERLGTDDYRQTIAEALVTGIQSFVDQHPTTWGKGRTNE